MIKNFLLIIIRKITNSIQGKGFWKYRIVKAAFYFVKSHLKTDIVEINGCKMILDPEDSHGLSIKGYYELPETEYVKEAIREGDIALDVGANIGYYTLLLAKLVGEKGKVFAFEPEPLNFEILKKNVELNNFQNVVLIQKAISNKIKKDNLVLSDQGYGYHHLDSFNENENIIPIEVTTLDEYFKDFDKKINFIKMDIEGLEWNAIEGMLHLLQKTDDLKMIVELQPDNLERFSKKPEDLFKILVDNGFTLYDLTNQKKKINFSDWAKFRKINTNILAEKGKLSKNSPQQLC